MKISDVLNKKGHAFHTISVTESLEKALQRFIQHGIGSLVVLNSQNFGVGLLTDRTVIEFFAKRGLRGANTSVGTVMISPAPSCRPDHDVRTAMSLMTELRTRHLIVAETHKIHGIVSLGDLVKYKLQDAELENLVLRDMAGARHVMLGLERPVYPGRP